MVLQFWNLLQNYKFGMVRGIEGKLKHKLHSLIHNSDPNSFYFPVFHANFVRQVPNLPKCGMSYTVGNSPRVLFTMKVRITWCYVPITSICILPPCQPSATKSLGYPWSRKHTASACVCVCILCCKFSPSLQHKLGSVRISLYGTLLNRGRWVLAVVTAVILRQWFCGWPIFDCVALQLRDDNLISLGSWHLHHCCLDYSTTILMHSHRPRLAVVMGNRRI